jgi:hypothetical protein
MLYTIAQSAAKLLAAGGDALNLAGLRGRD